MAEHDGTGAGEHKAASVVLVVEDEPVVRTATAMILEDEGFIVLEAGNADEALALLRARADVEVLFTDVDMPGSMDGLALARRAAEEWPWVAVLVTSGKAWPGAGELPPDARFMPKPYWNKDMLEQVRTVTGVAA